jgi:hypothetical protein
MAKIDFRYSHWPTMDRSWRQLGPMDSTAAETAVANQRDFFFAFFFFAPAFGLAFVFFFAGFIPTQPSTVSTILRIVPFFFFAMISPCLKLRVEHQPPLG